MAVSLQLWAKLNIFAITMLSPRARALSWRGARSRCHALRIDCILGAIPVFPRQRQTTVAPWLSEQRLVHVLSDQCRIHEQNRPCRGAISGKFYHP